MYLFGTSLLCYIAFIYYVYYRAFKTNNKKMSKLWEVCSFSISRLSILSIST